MTGLDRPTGVSSFTWKPTLFGNCVSLVLRSRMLSLSCHEFSESTNAFCSLILQSEVPCDFCLWQSSVGSKRNTCVSLSRPVVEDFPSEVDDWPRRKAVSTCRYLVIFPYVTLRRQVSPSFMRMTKTPAGTSQRLARDGNPRAWFWSVSHGDSSVVFICCVPGLPTVYPGPAGKITIPALCQIAMCEKSLRPDFW